MLPADDLTLAIEIQLRSYKLLRWIADAIKNGFVTVTHVHNNTNAADSAYDWIERHYFNLPQDARPERHHLRQFANFFSTYVLSSFDIEENPGTRFYSQCGCYCPLCARIVASSHLRPKTLRKQDKVRAQDLMVDRVAELALQEGLAVSTDTALAIVRNDKTRRAAGYSTYGSWLIKRTNGYTDGQSILALWREIAWQKTGAPIKNFELRYKDFVDAEELLVDAARASTCQL